MRKKSQTCPFLVLLLLQMMVQLKQSDLPYEQGLHHLLLFLFPIFPIFGE
jgi:hypothetical protein